jgi:hypothetical protein
MDTKNLMSSVKHVNRSVIEDLPVELVELSEEDLKQISGGRNDVIIGSVAIPSVREITITGGTTTFNSDGTFTNVGGTTTVVEYW